MDFARLGNVKRMLRKDLGVQVSINPSGVERGTKFANADERQISQCSAFILALSAELIKSEYATFELDMAIRNNIPCLILDIDSSTLPDPTGQYASIKHVGLEGLSAAMMALESEPAVAPAMPEPEPVAEPEPIAEPEPVAEPEPIAEPEPAVAPAMPEPEPVAEPEPTITKEDTPDPTYTWSDEDLNTPTVEPEQPIFTTFEPAQPEISEPAFESKAAEPTAWQSFNPEPEEEKNVIITSGISNNGKEKMLFDKQQTTYKPSKATQRHSIGNNNKLILWIILFIVFALLIGGGTWAYFEFLQKPDNEVKNDNDNENTEQSDQQSDNTEAGSSEVTDNEEPEVEVVDITTVEETPAPQQPAPEAQPAPQPSRPARSTTPARQRQEQRIEDSNNSSPSRSGRGYTLTPVDGDPANPDNNGTQQRRPYRIGN